MLRFFEACNGWSFYFPTSLIKNLFVKSPGGVTSIYTGTGRAIFWGAFFEQEINFGISCLVRL